MPSDPEQDRDEGHWLEAEEAEYWSKRNDPMTEYCEYCEGFYGECDCEEERKADKAAENEH
jgi:hypothetical protein